MAQPGLQTQLIYGSLTPGAVPQAAALTTNLSGVELAINAADGKLFYKDTAGFVKVLADVNSQGAQGIFQSTAASDAAIFTASEAHRVAMEASDTPEGYDFSGGWPASIEDDV